MSEPKIKVIGVGGSGCNTVSRMTKDTLKGVELIAVNTDAQILKTISAPKKVLIGEKATGGLGTGMDVNLGKKAVLESKEKIKELVKGADMVFITAGLGGGTGSPAAPIVAEITKDLGILTIGAFTLPFSFEGAQRKRIANSALKKLKGKVDTLLVIPNDKLLKLIDKETSVADAFSICDQVLKDAVEGVTNLIIVPGIINVDFADIKTIMKNSGRALFGTGRGEGKNRAVVAAKQAINSSLVNFSIKKAKGILFNVTGKNISLSEVEKAAEVITRKADSNAEVIFGMVQDSKFKKGELKILFLLW